MICVQNNADMTNAATFRDLSKPVGALNKERLDRLLVSPDLTFVKLYSLLCHANKTSELLVYRLATGACQSPALCTAAITLLQATSCFIWSELVSHTQ